MDKKESQSPVCDFSFGTFLEACSNPRPQCEECKEKARFLYVYAQEEEGQNGWSNINFHRVCEGHLTPDRGFDWSNDRRIEVVDLNNEFVFDEFTSTEIKHCLEKIHAKTHPLKAVKELKSFAALCINNDIKDSKILFEKQIDAIEKKLSEKELYLLDIEPTNSSIDEQKVKFNKHIKCCSERKDVFAECKFSDTPQPWEYYYEIVKKLFWCCAGDCYNYCNFRCGIEKLSTYFSKSSLSLYNEFYCKLLDTAGVAYNPDSFIMHNELQKALKKDGIYVEIIGEIFPCWFHDYMNNKNPKPYRQ